MTDHRSYGGLRPRMSPCLRHAQPDGRSIGVALNGHGPSESGDRKVGSGSVSHRSVGSKGRRSDLYDLIVRRDESIETQARLIENARRSGIEHEVAVANER